MSHEGPRLTSAARRGGTWMEVPWKVADVALAAAVVVAGFFAALLLLELVTKIGGFERPRSLLIGVVAASDGLMLAAVWAFGIRKYRTPWRSLGFRRPSTRRIVLWPVLALMASLAFTSLYVAITTALGADALRPSPLPEGLLGQGPARLFTTAVVAFWGPLAEEAFFRGFMIAALVPSLGMVWAALLGSAVFAAAHGSLGAMVPVFVTGLLLSWLYLRSRSLWQPLSVHVA